MSIANTGTKTIVEEGIIDDNDQVRTRIEHLRRIENLVGNIYPNKYDRSQISGKKDTITDVVQFAPIVEIVKKLKENTPEGEKPDQELKAKLNEKLKEFGNVRISGRLAVPPRVMGKAAFVHLSDGKSRLQIYVRRDDAKVLHNGTLQVIETEGAAWEVFKLLDHGDFIGAEGFLFLTNTGELSVHVEKFQFLAKALLPMPDKMHGIADPELRRRYRYADLLASGLQIEHEKGELTTREVFEIRARIISSIRRFLEDEGYTEVETPMLTPKATGATARPFETWHNALDIKLYARIAPELYLKRLLVGGFEKVYELNRNFRNEGLSHKHNPEFTMLEFYCAYLDSEGMMDFCEKLLRETVKSVAGRLTVKYENHQIDFGKFQRISMREAIRKYAPKAEIDEQNMIELFDELVEPNLIQPTFIVDFPKSISPLSKANPENPQVAERFELFINGMEVANGFSELNDPQEQYERFLDQMRERERGDEEAMVLDEDYIRALSFGMPPAAGIGIGIDRLVMLLTNKHSIRDVILFPHMRPEKHRENKQENEAEIKKHNEVKI
jgi:lysyl-tRNA synthetase class 2